MSEWKRPSDVMVMRKKRKPAAAGSSGRGGRDSTANNTGSQASTTGSSQAARKRSNPFGCPDSKRRNSSKENVAALMNTHDSSRQNVPAPMNTHNSPVEESAEENSDSLLNMLSDAYTCNEPTAADMLKETDKQEKHKRENKELQKRMNQRETTKSQIDSKTALIVQNENILQTEQQQSEDLTQSRVPPLDWSLCTRLRFFSGQLFDWCAGLTSTEESVGLVGFTQSQKPLVTEQQQVAGKEARYDLQKACMVWIHPNLPWCNIYPRMVADSNLGKPCQLFSTPEVQKALLNDWTESLTSAYNLVRSGQCPYFYLCTHQFNVLWRSSDTAGRDQVHALLSPTSRGLREAFTNEGIEFTMPLDKRRRKSAECAETENVKSATEGTDGGESVISKGLSRVDAALDDDDDDDDLAQTDEGASSWLQSIGLNSKVYKSLNPDKVKLARDGSQAIDQRAESCIQVEGPDTLGLLNYLLNCRSCIATTGAQAGLPPTLLAPVAFKGATLKQLKMKSQQIHRTAGSVEQLYGFEVSGPILPHTKLRLMNLFSRTHRQFSVSFSAHLPSAPFNADVSSAHTSDVSSAPFNANEVPSAQTSDNTLKENKLSAPSNEKSSHKGKSVSSPEKGGISDNSSEIDGFVGESELFKRSSQLGKKVIREAGFNDGVFSWAS